MSEASSAGRMQRLALAAALALGGVLALVALAVFLWPSDADGEQVFDLGRLERFPPGSVTSFNVRGDAAVLSPSGALDNNEAFHLVRLEDGEVRALLSRDPHLGCAVPWRPDFEFETIEGTNVGWFRNPCHGETYAMDGTRVFGPAPRDLDRARVEIEDGRVIVDLGDVTKGATPTPHPPGTPTPARTPAPTGTPAASGGSGTGGD